ncbi:MAG: tetratricopeptide repeat protein [Chlorobi bacterium]|nr:tetratricopeptide repeat protein [Chlorobiota bacterium]
MKTKLLTALIALIFYGGYAQKLTVQKYTDIQKKVLENARRYADGEAYRDALYRIIAVEGENSPYLDTLAAFYFGKGEMISFLRVSDQLLAKRPGDQDLLLKQAIAYEALGDLKKAVELYEKVFAAQPDNVELGYILAWDQYKLKRVEEAYNTLMKLKDKKFPDRKVAVPGVGQQPEVVPLEAAYYNLLGLVAYDLHNLDLAARYFGKAVEIHPQFQSAKQNKAAVEVMKQKLLGDQKENGEQKGK